MHFGQVELLPSQCSQQTAALVSFVRMSKELKRSLEMCVRGEGEGSSTPCVTIAPFTGDRNLSPMPQQWTHLHDETVCLTLWCSNVPMSITENEDTHLNPLIQTDMFLRLQPYDTRPGNWPCCLVQKRNRRERSADMESSDREYSARDTERLADVFINATQKWT